MREERRTPEEGEMVQDWEDAEQGSRRPQSNVRFRRDPQTRRDLLQLRNYQQLLG